MSETKRSAEERIEAAHEEIVRLCNGGDWRMRIPVDMERDSDMVLSTALDVAREALATVARVREIADFCAAKEADFEASYRTDGNAYAEASSDWLGVIEERLRAALTPTPTPRPVAAEQTTPGTGEGQ